MGRYLTYNASEVIFYLLITGLILACLRIRYAQRKDILLAVIVFMVGTLIREYAVLRYGVSAWEVEAFNISSTGKVIQVVGLAMLVRAWFKQFCGEWAWMLVFGVAIGLAYAT